MKSGTYTVSFNIDINECWGQKKAREAVVEALNKLQEEGELPEMGFELLEETNDEFTLYDSDGLLEELNFG